MNLYTKPGDFKTVQIRQLDYAVQVSGTGRPVLTIGPGSAMHRTLSDEFRTQFTLYAIDLYWIEQNSRADYASLNLQTILNDIAEIIRQLSLDKPILWGHSAFGIIALEFAKQYPDLSSGIIMIGTPVNSNEQVESLNNSVFLENAEPTRMSLYQSRCKEVAKMDLSGKTPAERFKIEYIYRDAPKYWHQADYDCSALWDGLLAPREFIPLFTDILPGIDVTKHLSSVKQPVYLAAGMSDYDCCPWHWEEQAVSPFDLTVDRYHNSGHYPHFEEPELFDQNIFRWVKILL